MLTSDGKVGQRHLITSGTPLDGGVYYSQNIDRAAVVVDSKYGSINRLFEEAKQNALEANYCGFTGERVNQFDIYTGEKTLSELAVLEAAYDVVFDNMMYSQEGVDKIIEDVGVQNGGKIKLDHFIDSGVGVCKEMALTVAAVLEQFKKHRLINGTPSINRNIDTPGGHAWTRYKAKDGKVYIIDVAQQAFGLEQELTNWDYRNPNAS